MKKQVFVFLMCVLVLLAFTASAQTYKDEVIYVLLTPAGEVTGVYVVNGFETDTAQEVTDYGVYKQVVNLTGAADIPYKDGVIALSLPAGRFFYQGDRETNDLPWTFDISYTLDGAAIAPEDLSGVTGHLVITFAAQSVAGMEAYTAGTTLQASITLNASKCLNIQADKATMAWAGNNLTLAYVVLPGAAASYQISADVTDFSMPGMQIAGIRMAMDAEMYEKMARERFADTPLADVAGNAIKSFLGEMQNATITSFADARNEVRSVQFVMLTQEIKEKQPEPAPTVAPEAQTPWTRLAALFGR